jgi:fibronectin-binding autotransporter adhesin
MSSKGNPYATKLNRGFDLVLLVIIVVTFAIFLRASAHGQTMDTLSASASSSAKPKPTAPPKPAPAPKPTPIPPQGNDGESLWINAGNDFNTAANWTGIAGGHAPPQAGDVAWFQSAVSNKAPNLSSNASSIGTLSGLYFNGTAASGYSITSSTTSIKFTLTATGATIGSETSDSTAVAIGAENTSGTNTISAPIILGAAASSTQTIYQATGGTLAISGVISNTNSNVGLTETGGGTLVFSGANTFTGQLTVQNGTLSIGTINNASTNGVLGNSSSSVILGGAGTTGTLEYTGASDQTNRNFTMATGGTGAFQVDTAATTLTYNGAIDGSGGLLKTGSGILLITNPNSYTGGTTINAGSILLSGGTTAGNLGSQTGTLTINSPGTLDFRGVPITVGNLTGSGTILNDFSNGTDNTGIILTIGNGGVVTDFGNFQGVIEDGTTGSGNGHGPGTVGLKKVGLGTIELSGANTYTGNTTISAGTLQFGQTNSMPSSQPVSVASGATLAVNAGGGTGEWTNGTSGAGTLGGLIAGTGGQGSANEISWTAGSVLGVDTTNASGGALTYGGVVGSFRTGGNSVGLTKLGMGALILTGANTYTGATTISGGTLQLGSGSTTGSLSASSAITDNANFTIDHSDAVTQGSTFSSSGITGTGSFTQAGTGTTTLNATNTFSGGLIIKTGTLANASNVNSLGSGTITLGDSSGFANATLSVGAGTNTYSNLISVASGNTGFATITNTNGQATFGGAVTLNNNLTVLGQLGQVITFTGGVTGTGNLTLNQSSGSGINSTWFSGGSVNNTGTITNASTDTSGHQISITSSVGPNVTGITQSSAGTSLAISGSISANATATTLTDTSGQLNISGGVGTAVGNLVINNNTSTANGIAFSSTNINNVGTVTNSGTVTGGGSNSETIGVSITGNVGSSNVSLVQNSATSKLILTAASTYTGMTMVSAGTLQLANSSGQAISSVGRITVNSGGTLLMGANNQVASSAPITLSGGKLDAGGFSQGTGGTSVGSPGTVGLGALTLSSSSTIDMTNTSVLHLSASNALAWTGALSILDWSGTLTTGGGSEQLLFGTNTTGITAAQLLDIQFVNPSGMAVGTYNAAFATDGTGEIVPGLTVVPEPSTWAIAALAMLMLSVQTARAAAFSRARERNRRPPNR